VEERGRDLICGTVMVFGSSDEEKHVESRSECPVYGPKFEIGTSRTRSRSATHSTATSDNIYWYFSDQIQKWAGHAARIV
jgi:hypothetical protein